MKQDWHCTLQQAGTPSQGHQQGDTSGATVHQPCSPCSSIPISFFQPRERTSRLLQQWGKKKSKSEVQTEAYPPVEIQVFPTSRSCLLPVLMAEENTNKPGSPSAGKPQEQSSQGTQCIRCADAVLRLLEMSCFQTDGI